MIAFAFIVWHVFHMHGWIHSDWWITGVAPRFDGAMFRPYNAASTAGAALQSGVVVALYVIGVLSCVYHLANGLWTMGITWGVWLTPAAQRRADYVCIGFGVILAAISMGALFGMRSVDQAEAKRMEDQMYRARVESGEITPDEHKRKESDRGSGGGGR
jgi:succinate dehydrogenase / fumarate reductase cytochrome b subunit